MIDIWLKQERSGIHERFKKQDSDMCKYRKVTNKKHNKFW